MLAREVTDSFLPSRTRHKNQQCMHSVPFVTSFSLARHRNGEPGQNRQAKTQRSTNASGSCEGKNTPFFSSGCHIPARTRKRSAARTNTERRRRPERKPFRAVAASSDDPAISLHYRVCSLPGSVTRFEKRDVSEDSLLPRLTGPPRRRRCRSIKRSNPETTSLEFFRRR